MGISLKRHTIDGKRRYVHTVADLGIVDMDSRPGSEIGMVRFAQLDFFRSVTSHELYVTVSVNSSYQSGRSDCSL